MFQGGFCLCLVFSHPRRPCFVRRGVSPPAGGELLCPWRQSNQNATGDGSDEHFVLIVAYPTPSGPSGHLPLTGGVGPGPHYEGYPLDRAKHFRRAKSEWLVPISIGPLGPGLPKITVDATPFPRLGLPSKRSRSVFWRFPYPNSERVSLKPVGEGLKVNRPKAERSHPGV